MRKNRALDNRVLDIVPNNDNNVMMYRRLISLIEEYNRMAKDRGMPIKSIPVYTNNINRSIIVRSIVSILKDIDMAKNIKEDNGSGGGDGGDTPPSGEKILKNVVFTNGSVSSGSWTYTIISNSYTVSASLTGVFRGEAVTLGYGDMPYEKLITDDKTEYLTVSYKDAFKELPSGITALTINGWTNSNITDMSNMFAGCEKLTSISLGNNFNTATVLSMQSMFYECSSLASISFGSNFNTSAVMDMSSMFYGCSALTTLDLSGFKTANVENMSLMFYECYSMTNLTGINKWNTSKVQTLNNTFGRCKALIELDLSGWNLSSITDAFNMFTSCDNLEAMHINKSVYDTFIPIRFETGIVFAEWFYGDEPLRPTLLWKEDLKLSDTSTIMITAFSSIVYNGTFDALESATPPYFTDGIYRYSVVEYPANSDKRVINVILNDKSITRLDIPESVSPASFVMDSEGTSLPVASYANMLSEAYSLEYVDVSEWNTDNVTNMSNLFAGCRTLMDIKGIGEWKTSNVTDMRELFGGCYKLQSISLPKWTLNNNVQLDNMFLNAGNMIILTIPLDMAKRFYSSSTNIGLQFNTWYYGNTQLSNDVLNSISSSVVTFTKDPATVLSYDSAFPTGDTSFTEGEWQYKIYKATVIIPPKPDDPTKPTDPPIYKPAYIEARLTNEALSAGKTPSSSPASVVTDADFASLPVLSLKQAFMGSMATSIVINGWNTDFINDMSGLFMNCNSLKSATLNDLVNSNVTNLYGMFAFCTSLTSINGLNRWDTSKVIDMSSMFAFCASLEALDLSNWIVDIEDDEKIKDIFTGCTALTRVKLSKGGARLLPMLPAPSAGGSWRIVRNNTQTELTDLEWDDAWGEGAMWFVCYTISADKTLTGVTFTNNAYTNGMWTYTLGNDGIRLSIYESGLPEISNGTLTLDYEHMPYEKLVTTDGTEYITMSYYNAFMALPETVKTLNIKNWTNRTIDTMANMFARCSSLTSLTLGTNFDTSNVTNMANMFAHCSSLTSLTLGTNFDTSNVTNMSYMFSRCLALESLSLGDNFNTSGVDDMSGMFYDCSSLTSLTLGTNFDTSSVTTMYGMFEGCWALESLTLGDNFNTSKVKTMVYMFYGCSSLKSLTLGDNFDTSSVTNMYSMIRNCSKLTTLTLGENFVVPSDYGSSTKMYLSPSAVCTITMNKTMYDALKQYDLASYTFSPDTWDTSGGTVQEITVTPP